MDDLIKKKIASCQGNDGCQPDLTDGKSVVNKIRQVGVGMGLLPTPFEIACSCQNTFTMRHYEDKCPHCMMVYGVTPCTSHDKENIKAAGINY